MLLEGMRLEHRIRNSCFPQNSLSLLINNVNLQLIRINLLLQQTQKQVSYKYFFIQGPDIHKLFNVDQFFQYFVIIITLIINGMINTTFASIKLNKQNMNQPIKNGQIKRNDALPTTFKEIRQYKQGNMNKNIVMSTNKKTLQNQQNTFSNALYEHANESTQRKNLIKVEKSRKKVNLSHAYKSPSHKVFEIGHFYNKDKSNQASSYKPKAIPQKNEENIFPFTPSIIKNHLFRREQTYSNSSYFTQKHKYTQNSQNSSISVSSKASLDDSFRLNQVIISYEQEEKGLKNNYDNVISSMELRKQVPMSHRQINDFNKYQNQIKSMKKSSHFYCSNITQEDERTFKTLEQASVSSSVSSNISNSINFTQKFKHYKRQHTKSQLKPQQSFSLSHFKLIDQIGSGKYGKVYLARHNSTGFICAIKSVSKKIIKEENLEIPFIRQVKIQMYLNHPNIVKLYGFFHDKENVYLIMEYCSGHHLFKLIRQKVQFQEEQIISILSNVFEAVLYIHCHGVIHRDLKPQNIVIQNGVYKLCDFGWAAYACGDSRTTFCGTPLYVCPEVLKGQEYNTKADIWGLGIITYQLTFGRVPFSIINQSDLMKIIKDPVYFPVWGNTSEKLKPYIQRMLSKNPDDRPSINQILSTDIFRTYSQKISMNLKSELDKLF